MAIEVSSYPLFLSFRLFGYVLGLLYSVVSYIFCCVSNKKSRNLKLILLGAVAIHLDVVFRIQYKLQDLHLFTDCCIFISSRKDNLVLNRKQNPSLFVHLNIRCIYTFPLKMSYQVPCPLFITK